MTRELRLRVASAELALEMAIEERNESRALALRLGSQLEQMQTMVENHLPRAQEDEDFCIEYEQWGRDIVSRSLTELKEKAGKW